jgi:hypothetical protein
LAQLSLVFIIFICVTISSSLSLVLIILDVFRSLLLLVAGLVVPISPPQSSTYLVPLHGIMARHCMASVSLDQEVIILGKNGNYIIIIHSIIGGRDRNQIRSEILSFNGVEWTELGQLGIPRAYFAATTILVDHTVCG